MDSQKTDAYKLMDSQKTDAYKLMDSQKTREYNLKGAQKTVEYVIIGAPNPCVQTKKVKNPCVKNSYVSQCERMTELKLSMNVRKNVHAKMLT